MHFPYLDLIWATGPFSIYGHGGAAAQLPVSEVRKVARFAVKSGGCVRLSDGLAICQALDERLGRRHELGLRLSDFEVIFSVRVHGRGHINIEEGQALVHFVKWILRSCSRFCYRVLVLVDSKVVIGAATQGRSSSL